MFTEEDMKGIFILLERCRGVEQDEVHHPEGDVLSHTLQVLEIAFRESYDLDLIFAAMFHDIGKAFCKKGHETVSCKMAGQYCTAKTMWLIENHMKFWYFILGEMRRKQKVQNLILSPWFIDLTLLCRWDKMGRNPNKKMIFDEKEIINKLNAVYQVGIWKFNQYWEGKT